MEILTCHCKKVIISVFLPNGIVGLERCNCSICTKHNAIMVPVKIENLKIIKGKEELKLYQFHTKKAKHYFCKVCGIYTHHKSRSNPDNYVFNLSCLEGINLLDYTDIPVFDGLNFPDDNKK